MPEWSSGFLYCLQFKSEFGNKEFMIWATVSSQSCFCWLYRASPPLATENIINFISVLMIWWCPCVVFSCVVGRGCLLWPVHFLGKTLLAFALLHFVLQDQTCLLLQVSLDLHFCIPVPFNEKDIFLGVSSRRFCRSVELLSFSFFGISDWGIDLDYCDVEWFTLEMNRDHSVIFETASKYCILDSFVDYEG